MTYQEFFNDIFWQSVCGYEDIKPINIQIRELQQCIDEINLFIKNETSIQ